MRTSGMTAALVLSLLWLGACQSRPAPAVGARSGALPDEAQRAARELVGVSDLIVLGTVTAVHDRTHRDAGMTYDVRVRRVISGNPNVPTLRFNSSGWIGYARHEVGEDVLLFLSQSAPFPDTPWSQIAISGKNAICHIRGDMVEGPLGTRPLSEYRTLLEQAGSR